MSLIDSPLLLLPVDILEFVGLRSGTTLPGDDDISLAVGPTGELDAYRLERELNASTSDSSEWDMLGVDFPNQFGLYIIFNVSDYEGSIVSVSNDSGLVFDVSLRSSENLTNDVLEVTLPGLDTLEFNLPDGLDLRGSNSFQSVGIRLHHYQLLVIVNCTVVSFLDLPESSQPLPVSEGVVRVFSDETVVRQYYIVVMDPGGGVGRGWGGGIWGLHRTAIQQYPQYSKLCACVNFYVTKNEHWHPKTSHVQLAFL